MQNLVQVRVVDPILTTFVRGYTNNELVGQLLFPNVDVDVSGGQVLEFGKEAFLLYDTQRAPGSATKRVELGYLGKPYALEIHSLEAMVPDQHGRDAALVPGINLGQEAVGLTFDAMALKLEYQRAKLARDPNNYAASNKIVLSGTAQWDANGVPKADITAGASAIRAQTGKKPNVLILPPMGISKLDRNADVRDRLKYTNGKTVTGQALADYFEVETVVEGGAVYATSATGNFIDVWGKDAVLAYVPKNFRSMRAPSYGYTYNLAGNPNVAVPYRDNNRRSWVYGVDHERAPVIAGAGAGYLLQNIFS
ncbi:MAG: hypothetical protein GAK35_03389 [Herbaspirillum frisingense]|uniref:Major capsid protein n=1 Tax=Herbaspirillum frisingense TaxID=92645 RepID=A0A7V8FUC9_9BURK|nr:MAG: hypothetical protein GAK35_03389 [Herbaspirillum frisingense]